MFLMIAGLVLFLGAHLVPIARGTRRMLVARAGEQRYKGLFSIVSGVGLVLIIAGYWLGDRGPQVFAPVLAARRVAPLVVTITFILFAASHMRGHIRRVLRHPMTIGVVLWSGVHLLANGDLRGTVLFGSFFAWSLLDLAASYARRPIEPYAPAVRFDLMAVLGGVLVAGVVMFLHPYLFGVRPY